MVLDAASQAKKPSPPLTRKPDMAGLVRESLAGHPRRVRLRFHHPVSVSSLPTFSVSDYETDDVVKLEDVDIMMIPFVHAVFPKQLIDGHLFEHSKSAGSTTYVMTGYFSGRLLDKYE
ncbi:hypothetical protein [Polyangium sp. 15x6]|uniref:hypothetical protein n=1 Tax=Polyangium sp. 15x6 TaxID=3042687 RepID=UPI00249AADA8|nr:hypothetical protein [Polyangium sp. 15x6]MDI3288703.1 hypothetical protein [Polyangium sp. 15x6]